MPSRAARRSIWNLAASALAVLLLVSAVPYVASTQIVRNRIAQELSVWSGYRVVLRGAPRIDVWPSFKAVLNDVAFQEWGKPDAAPALQADRVELDLSAIAALRGEIVFSRGTFVRPVLRVSKRDGLLPMPPIPDGGRIAQAITAARSIVDAGATAPSTGALPEGPVGTVEFSEGRILFQNGSGEDAVVTDLSGKLAWPTLNRAASLSVKGIWRGENVSLDISASKPLTLLAGGSARVTFSMASTPLTASFDGTATLSKSGFVDGTATLSSQSFRRALEWSQTEISPGAAVGPASISGRVIGDLQRLKVENADVVLGGNPGMGVLDFSFAGQVPSVAGTLAFESLDLRSFLFAFTRLPSNGDGWSEKVDTSFARQLSLDLRLSAANATAGPLALAEVAATVQVKDGLAAFDISDATAFGGTLQAGLRIDRRGGKDATQVRVLASDVDTMPFAVALSLVGPLPQAKGTISVILNGPAETWESLLSRCDGTVSVKLGAGAVVGIDLAAFLERARQGGFFALKDVSSGSFPISAAELKATVSNGVARLEIAKAISENRAISLAGIVPYVGRGIALSGLVAPRELPARDAAAGDQVTAFFVGGSWSAPFVSPVVNSTQPFE